MHSAGCVEAMVQIPLSTEGDFEDVEALAILTGARRDIPNSSETSVQGAISPGPQVISRAQLEVHCTDDDYGTRDQPICERPGPEALPGSDPKILRNQVTARARRDPSCNRASDRSPRHSESDTGDQRPSDEARYGGDMTFAPKRVAEINRDIDEHAAAKPVEQTHPK